MREIFERIAKELEDKDAWFRDVLSQKTTIDTSLETWSVTRDVAEKLYHIVLTEKPQRIVEVGMSQGYSTIWLAEAAKSYGGKVITIEREESKIAAAQEKFLALGLEETITIMQGDACDILKQWKEPINFLFLDAVKREYVTYLRLADPYLSPGSSIVADDVVEWRRKLDDFFEYIEKNPQYYAEVLPLGHGLCVIKKTA